jgi:hypothetical protein
MSDQAVFASGRFFADVGDRMGEARLASARAESARADYRLMHSLSTMTQSGKTPCEQFIPCISNDTLPRNVPARNARAYPEPSLPGLARQLRVLSQREAECGLAAGRNASAVAVPANCVRHVRNHRRRRAAGLAPVKPLTSPLIV